MKALNILIIEDEVILGADIKKTLERAGHTIMAVARSYTDASRALSEGRPDLAILDIMLDGVDDGMKVGRELLYPAGIPIIVLTGNSEDDTYYKVRDAFVPACYLLKPFRHADLPKQIDCAWQNFGTDRQVSRQDSVFLPVGKGFDRIQKSEVVYIITEKGTHSVNIHEAYRKTPRLVLLAMGHLSQYFNTPDFFKMSRSLIVNLNYIERIEGGKLKFQDDDQWFSIPEANRSEFMRRLTLIRGGGRSH